MKVNSKTVFHLLSLSSMQQWKEGGTVSAHFVPPKTIFHLLSLSSVLQQKSGGTESNGNMLLILFRNEILLSDWSI